MFYGVIYNRACCPFEDVYVPKHARQDRNKSTFKVIINTKICLFRHLFEFFSKNC